MITARLASDTDVAFTVADQGCGVASEHMNAVFDPFFTTKKRGEGTGLGLTIVEGIVRNHGGQITLASSPGEGTMVDRDLARRHPGSSSIIEQALSVSASLPGSSRSTASISTGLMR